MSTYSNTDKLKDALYMCILKALSNDAETRKSAEEQIRVMEVVSGETC